MKKNLLDYNFPEDLKTMSEKEMGLLTYEIRDFLIENVSKTGGHIASNLGVVELSIALHKVYDSPKDKIIWDVGHQCYTHKILTGRAAQFPTLRKLNGMSGFPKRSESPHDIFDSGHSSNSISAALGIATARTLSGNSESVIAVIGDGALASGIAFEALNNAGHIKERITVVLNDNEMSISKNTGGMSQHLGKLRLSAGYNEFKKQLKKTITGIPRVGEGIFSGLEHIKDTVKYAIVPGAIFEELGFRYLGPVDGHNIHDLIEIFSIAKLVEGPVLIHVVTKKGKGYITAERNPCKFHGIGAFDPETGETSGDTGKITYSEVFGNKLIQMAMDDPKIVAICAAMTEGTGLERFGNKFPDRIFDVGIAEQHAVSFAAGLAINGYKPVVAIYSTFLQRAYDEVMLDICLQKLPVIFAIDRAGVVGADGETHHGIFDLTYLSSMPNLTILAPKDGRELAEMMEYAHQLKGPCAIRYPRGEAADHAGICSNHKMDGKAEIMREGTDATVIAVGKMVTNALKALSAEHLENKSIELINARSVRPLDSETLLDSIRKTKTVITVEDNIRSGGFGSAVLQLISEHGLQGIRFASISWPDRFIQQGSMSELESIYGLDPDSIARKVRETIETKA